MVTQSLFHQTLTLAECEQVVNGNSPTSLGSFCLVHHLSWWSLVHNGYRSLILPTHPGVEFDLCTFLPPSPADKPTLMAFRAKSPPARVSSKCQNFIFDSALGNSLQCAPSNWYANYYGYIFFSTPRPSSLFNIDGYLLILLLFWKLQHFVFDKEQK